MAQTHNIKILREFADAVYDGRKQFEVRVNDRDYQVGDAIVFSVVDWGGEPADHPLNGRTYEITYVLSNWGIEAGSVAIGIKPVSPNSIYTHDEAALIVELFEDVLSKYNIHIPSPEDDEREEDNMVGLYGSTYSDLLDCVESSICSIIARCKRGDSIIKDEFSGTI